MNITDIFLEDFLRINIYKLVRIPMIVIYNKPKNYPEHYIARLWDGNKPTNYTIIRDSLDSIRAAIPPMNRISRSEKDDPVIVETWI